MATYMVSFTVEAKSVADACAQVLFPHGKVIDADVKNVSIWKADDDGD